MILFAVNNFSLKGISLNKYVPLGNTNLMVSRHGFGAARIGEGTPRDEIQELFNTLLELGITFIDTADCYTNSEEIIGEFLKDHKNEFVIATKCGCVSGKEEGVAYSPEVIRRNIDRSLRRLGVEYLDLVYLHTCSASVLRSGEAVDALLRQRDAGKVRFVGYSGDGEDALCAIGMGVFDALQVTFNILDQTALSEVLPAAERAGIGVVAKRPIANAKLLLLESPYFYQGAYWDPILSVLNEEGVWEDPLECALRFTLSHAVVASAIIGTTNVAHVRANVARANKGPLPLHVLKLIHELTSL